MVERSIRTDTTLRERIKGEFQAIEPEILAAARALGVEGKSCEAVLTAVKVRLALLKRIQELLDAASWDFVSVESAHDLIDEDLAELRKWLPEALNPSGRLIEMPARLSSEEDALLEPEPR
jgi:hypothetical protein